MEYVPRGCQTAITKFIIDHQRANVWADPGVGKTAATLTAIEAIQLAGTNALPALVIAPLRVARRVWSDEAAKWDHTKDLKVNPALGKNRADLLKRNWPVTTINYENIPWLVDHYGDKWPFRTVIADEATALRSYRGRNGGKRAAALASIVKHTVRWINLTGTPMPNGLANLWGQCWFLDGGKRLGRTYSEFIRNWFYEAGPYKVLPRKFAEEGIPKILSDITISIRAEDWLDLPPLVVNDIVVDLPPRARAAYARMEKSLVAALPSGAQAYAATTAAMLMKLAQFSSGATYVTPDTDDYEHLHDAKLDALAELADDLNGAPLLVVYRFRHTLARLSARFPEGRPLQSTKDEDDWNAGRIPMLFVQPRSAGHGLNLQWGGNHIAFVDIDYDLETYQQVIERIGPTRQLGLDRSVFVYHIVADGTVDQDIADALRRKSTAQTTIRNIVNRLKR